MSLYIPENMIITKDAKSHPETQVFSNIIKGLNPKINISYSNNERPKYQGLTTQPAIYNMMKKTIVLAFRKSSFIETFPSPGRIIEKMNTMIKPSFHCCFGCQYCYLQPTAFKHPWQKIYVNFNQIENELVNEFVIDPLLRSILTVLAKLNNSSFDKIPKNFKTVADKIRNSLSGFGSKSPSENSAKDYLKTMITFILADLGVEYDSKKLKRLIPKLDMIYDKNKKYIPIFNVSEYSDSLGISHISGNMDYLMNLIQKYNNFKMTFYTKSADIDPVLNYNGYNRVKSVMHMDTQYVIDNYQKGTPSLDERIEAGNKLLSANGFKLKLSFEPILMYKDYEKDYLETIRKVAKKIDLTKLESINLGGVRFSGQLISIIKSNYPNTDILNLEKPLEPPTGEKKT